MHIKGCHAMSWPLDIAYQPTHHCTLKISTSMTWNYTVIDPDSREHWRQLQWLIPHCSRMSQCEMRKSTIARGKKTMQVFDLHFNFVLQNLLKRMNHSICCYQQEEIWPFKALLLLLVLVYGKNFEEKKRLNVNTFYHTLKGPHLKLNYCSSRRMVLALNNQQRLICH